MRVHYTSSLWEKGRGFPGLPQRTGWQFEYAGARRIIPAVYRFPRGVVFDILTPLDEDELRAYYEKYESAEDKLTPLQRRCAEQEHPYRSVPVREIWVDGKQAEGGWSSSGIVSIPWARPGEELAAVRRVYASVIGDSYSFALERFCVPYPAADTAGQRLLRFFRLSSVREMKLTTGPEHRFTPLEIRFELTGGDGSKEITFTHPVTRNVHTLWFRMAEALEVPLMGGSPKVYAATAEYEMEPALPSGDALQFGGGSYGEKRDGDICGPAASIGIIGGADGPTALFVATGRTDRAAPRGPHGLPKHRCLSVPAFQREQSWRFVIEGVSTTVCDGREFSFR